MPTSTKKSKPKPPAGRKPKNKKNGGLGGAIAGLAPNLRPAKKSTRSRKSSNRGLAGIAAGAGMRTRPLRPSRKGLVGIAAGAGLGGAAMAKRRRRGHQNEATNRPPSETPAAPMEDVPTNADRDHANNPNGGAEHGDPKGPDFADAA